MERRESWHILLPAINSMGDDVCNKLIDHEE